MPGFIRPLLCALLLVAPASLAAQDTAHAPAQSSSHDVAPGGDFITPHIVDSHHLEFPIIGEVALPHWAPIQIGKYAIDISPTKHVVFMGLSALLSMLFLIGAARSSTAGHRMIGRPKGFAAAIEALALYIRNDVVLANVGPHGEKFVPYGLTLFFFILFCNLLGLIPYGATATSNISVTATLAIVTFFVIEIAGIRANGWGYLRTIFYWNTELPILVRVPMFFIMSPVELVGKLAKPFALAIRLFANMTAGHIVLLAMIGLIFSFGSYVAAIAPVGLAVGISLLELFVSFLQAFIFTLLTSVFIGLMRESHH